MLFRETFELIFERIHDIKDFEFLIFLFIRVLVKVLLHAFDNSLVLSLFVQLPHAANALPKPAISALFFLVLVVHVKYDLDGIVVDRLEMLVEFIRHIVVALSEIPRVEVLVEELGHALLAEDALAVAACASCIAHDSLLQRRQLRLVCLPPNEFFLPKVDKRAHLFDVLRIRCELLVETHLRLVISAK